MADVYRNGRFEADSWQIAAADAAVGAAWQLLPKARFLAEAAALADASAPLGLVLEPNDTLDDLDADLARFAVIAIKFPKFGDGRGFSLARLLRERYGYTGEIRATGDVLIDLIPFMWRVGFDALEVVHAPTRAALADGKIVPVPFYYQPAADAASSPSISRPWLRKAV